MAAIEPMPVSRREHRQLVVVENVAAADDNASSSFDDGSSASSPPSETTQIRSDLLAFECDVCHKRFRDRRLLDSHLDVSRPCNPKGKEARCTICGLVFKSNQAATNHVRMHDKDSLTTREKNFICRICELPMISEDALRLHLHKHINVQPFQCRLCGRRLHTKYSLEKHLELHNRGARSFGCDACGQRFSSKTELSTHERRMHAVREWKCRFCEKMFFKKAALEQHENLHTLNNLLRCPHCPKRFSASQSLRNHIKSTHGLISGDIS